MVGMATDVGNIRHNNEDNLKKYEDSFKRIYIVADGMGGHKAGEVASKLAVDFIVEYFKSLNTVDKPISNIKEAIKLSNKEIFEFSRKSINLNGMGTTITAALIIGNKAYIANVGDSSCYLYNNNELKKITKDHSFVQELIDDGTITEAQAFNHPNKNIITRALGTNIDVEVDIFEIAFKEKDKLILCTDGLTNELEKDEILDILKDRDNQLICEKLIKECKNKGGRDNITVIVVGGE